MHLNDHFICGNDIFYHSFFLSALGVLYCLGIPRSGPLNVSSISNFIFVHLSGHKSARHTNIMCGYCTRIGLVMDCIVPTNILGGHCLPVLRQTHSQYQCTSTSFQHCALPALGRGRVHLGQVASSSQGWYMKINNHSRSHLHLQAIYQSPINLSNLTKACVWSVEGSWSNQGFMLCKTHLQSAFTLPVLGNELQQWRGIFLEYFFVTKRENPLANFSWEMCLGSNKRNRDIMKYFKSNRLLTWKCN